MATMPSAFETGQPARASAWFATPAGACLLDCEGGEVAAALATRPAQPWLWLAPVLQGPAEGRGVRLAPGAHGWQGDLACGDAWPLPSETFGTVVIQHVATPDAAGAALLSEAARLLVPGGRAWLVLLNPLSPYRWRWRGHGLRAAEPLRWRRRLREAGLVPLPVSRGLGPSWSVRADAGQQDGPGMRAAYVLQAEKRQLPLTPVRARAALPIAQGAGAA
jgi:SAM-dependent methyltransferase